MGGPGCTLVGEKVEEREEGGGFLKMRFYIRMQDGAKGWVGILTLGSKGWVRILVVRPYLKEKDWEWEEMSSNSFCHYF